MAIQKTHKKELIHSGSVKNVYRVDDETVEFEFSDRVSVFDKPIGNEIPGKGETLCDSACHWFEKLSNNGIPNHFLERTGSKSVRVKSVQIIKDYSRIVDGKTNHLIPLEFIARHYCAGSLNDRLKSGKIQPQEVGAKLGETIAYGQRLPSPYFEFSTKLEPVDRFLGLEEALKMARMKLERLEEIRLQCFKIDDLIEKGLQGTNLIHVDGKKEFGYDKDGTLMIVDVFGTADEDRYWDRQRYEDNGQQLELSKEAIRHHYRETGYKDQLYEARELKKEEPPIPDMPEELVAEVAKLYRSIADQIVGKK